ncbi:MAG TPA: toll/interleukin-1 receptor domain-containing protein [Opitutaceae bacterium]|nr:toll/interleukin-1 receptor domain-containing protein [Opitutaceae bacterium]
MASFTDQKSNLSAEAREFLDFVWSHYLQTGQWPTLRVVRRKWDKPELDHILSGLSGALLMETENGGSTMYELRFLGILCTSEGEAYLELLRRYLGLLRDIYFDHQEKDSVSHVDAAERLGLKTTAIVTLGRLIFSGFLPSSGGHSQNFDAWQISLPKAIEDLPRSGPLDESLERILDQAAQTPLRLRLQDRIADLSSIGDPFKEAVPEENELGGGRVPDVFISYSHDSKEHKIWVLELAQRLRSHGIDVRLDQWDLEFGGDVPKFMERSVTEAERVLMICTEPYVRKVDEGKGGAAYEAMIVTAELIRDLGTNKFIPVIRHDSGKVVLPRCIGSRYAVNLSVSANFEEEFTKLIEQLRHLPPPTKPPLGKALAPSQTSHGYTGAIKAFSDDPAAAYEEALSLARASDLVSWRKLVAVKKSAVIPKLNLWRESVDKKGGPRFPETEGEMPAFVSSAMHAYGPIMAVAIAGAESCQPKFNQQTGLIYDLLEAPGWERTGSSQVVTMPEAAAFTFQALLGAMAIFSSQNGLACDLALLRISDPMVSLESSLLYTEHRLIGWPRSFDTKCTPAWNYLINLPESLPWVAKAFGSASAFRESLCGYYLVLSWIEFLDFMKADRVIDPKQHLRFDVPTLFFRSVECSGGARRVLEDRNPLLALSAKCRVDAARQIAAWPEWVNAGFRWVNWVFSHAYIDTTRQEPLRHFAADLHR